MSNDTILLRANLMGGMNEYIKEIGDEEIYDLWVQVFPDECDEETLMEIAEDDEIWLCVVNRFAACLKIVKLI